MVVGFGEITADVEDSVGIDVAVVLSDVFVNNAVDAIFGVEDDT